MSRLPLIRSARAALRVVKPSDIWFKPALSSTTAGLAPNLLLLALGRLDLVMFTMAGSLCALYGHNLPYAARARASAWVVLGMTAGFGTALLAGSLTTSVLVLVVVGAALAAAQKAVCEATRIGPPGNVIFAFVSSSALFVHLPTHVLPERLGLTLAAGAFAWLVAMAPALVRPDGPQRIATVRALRAAAGYAAEPGPQRRAMAAALVHAAWESLLAVRTTSPTRRGLERLVAGAEAALARTGEADPQAAARLTAWAEEVRVRGVLPVPEPDRRADAEVAGVDAERTLARSTVVGRGAGAGAAGGVRQRLAPRAAVWPIATRAFLGCLLAGWASYALGVGRPAWALVTAASLYQANLTLTWTRALQRVLGNLLGALVFVALIPVFDTGRLALVLGVAVFSFGAEALITRNYWLGSICVTPMALVMTEFAQRQDGGTLASDRVLDTLVGAVVGLAAALLVTNRRTPDRIGQAVSRVESARARTETVLAAATMGAGAGAGAGAAGVSRTRADAAPGARGWAAPGVGLGGGLGTGLGTDLGTGLGAERRQLTAALVELRTAVDAAAGEWWVRALPQERVMRAEEAGHRTLAEAVLRQGLTLPQALTVRNGTATRAGTAAP